MSSQEPNEGNINSGASSSQVRLFSMEFKLNLNRKLDDKIAALEAQKQNLIDEDEAWKKEMKARYANIKRLKTERKSAKIDVEKLRKTHDDQVVVAKDLDDYVRLLKADLKKQQEQTDAMAKEQREAIETMENRWQTLQAKYETLPLAVVRTEEQTKLQKAKIEVMVKEHRLAEIKEIVSQRKRIETTRRNNLVIEIAQLRRESKIEDEKMRAVLAARKNLELTLRSQEKTLAELAKKQAQQLPAPERSAMEKSNEMMKYLLTPSQECPLPIPRFDSSGMREICLTQPMPTLTKEYDAMSITSSVIDNIINPKETDEHDGQDCGLPTDAGLLQSDDKGIDDRDSQSTKRPTDEEGRGVPPSIREESESCASLRFERMDEEEEEFQRFSAAVAKRQEMEGRSLPLIPEQEEEQAREEDSGDWRAAERVESEYWQAYSKAEVERPAQSCPSEVKKPRITRTEEVQLNLRYDWKANCPSRMFSFSESQRAESVIGSELSMQSEDDFMKKLHFPFSPEHGGGKDSDVEFTPRAAGSGPSQIVARQRALGFLAMGNIPDTPTGRGNKKDFLSMF